MSDTAPAFRYAPNPAGCACRDPARSWSPRCAVCGRFYGLRPVLVPVDWRHDVERLPIAEPAQGRSIFAVWRPKRARRRAARARGRRNAIAVPPMPRHPPMPTVRYIALVAHRFANGRRAARLYLPEGEAPAREHEQDLDAVLR